MFAPRKRRLGPRENPQIKAAKMEFNKYKQPTGAGKCRFLAAQQNAESIKLEKLAKQGHDIHQKSTKEKTSRSQQNKKRNYRNYKKGC